MSKVLEMVKPILATSESPGLGPQRRESALALAAAEKLIDRSVEAAGLVGTSAQLVRALGLLWHDHLDASHTISQAIHTPDGSFVHGIMHRREPDFGNAVYWFRRVGDHPIYPQLAEKVGSVQTTSPFRDRLMAGGRWNPLALVDACEAVEVEADDAGDADFLRKVQALEFQLLLQHTCEMDRV